MEGNNYFNFYLNIKCKKCEITCKECEGDNVN